MFTGLIEEMGTLTAVRPLASGRRLEVLCHRILDDLKLGDSVALNGACQTVVEVRGSFAVFEAVGDTLTKTSLGTLPVGSVLNLERACRADSRLGGHFVLGHAQAMAEVIVWEPRGAGWTLEVTLPVGLRPYVVAEGSVAVDGISLTVAEVTTRGFRISVIPHTRNATNLGHRRVGDMVNLEVDILAKYVEALVGARDFQLDSGTLLHWGYR